MTITGAMYSKKHPHRTILRKAESSERSNSGDMVNPRLPCI